MQTLRYRELVRLIALLLASAAIPASLAQQADTPAHVIKRETQEVADWTVHIHPTLLQSHQQATKKALVLLGRQLREITRQVPAAAVAKLQTVPLYFSPPYQGFGSRAEFHPGRQWLIDNGRDPEMAKAVEFTNILNFEDEMVRMPNFALHELAHAYHNLFLPEGFGNPDITKAFEAVKSSGRYQNVERWHGVSGRRTQEKAYALTNPMEYFAETSEAYFSKNDFFPFDQEELKAYDPQMFELLTKLWSLE